VGTPEITRPLVRRRLPALAIAIYEDMIYFLAHDGAIVDLDAKT
jgi:hypothetical protein